MTIQIDLKARFINVVTPAKNSYQDMSGQFFFREMAGDLENWLLVRLPSGISDDQAVRDIMNSGWVRTQNAQGERVYVQITSIISGADRAVIEAAAKKFMHMTETPTPVLEENTMITPTLATIEAELSAITLDFLAQYTLSDMVLERTQHFMEILRPYRNDDLLELDVLQAAVETFRANPAVLLQGSVIQDGVVYPEIQDEQAYQAGMTQITDSFKTLPAVAAATATFITEVMYQHYPALRKAA